MISLHAGLVGLITSLIAIVTIYAASGFPAEFIANLGLAYEQESSGRLDEFVYTIDPPAYVKQLGSKEIEKDYEFSDVDEGLSGIKIKASHVKLHVKTKPLQSGTKIVFDAQAEEVEINGLGYKAKKDSAQVSGYAILNEEMTKLTMHIPWGEIIKNL